MKSAGVLLSFAVGVVVLAFNIRCSGSGSVAKMIEDNGAKDTFTAMVPAQQAVDSQLRSMPAVTKAMRGNLQTLQVAKYIENVLPRSVYRDRLIFVGASLRIGFSKDQPEEDPSYLMLPVSVIAVGIKENRICMITNVKPCPSGGGGYLWYADSPGSDEVVCIDTVRNEKINAYWNQLCKIKGVKIEGESSDGTEIWLMYGEVDGKKQAGAFVNPSVYPEEPGEGLNVLCLLASEIINIRL